MIERVLLFFANINITHLMGIFFQKVIDKSIK